MAWGWWGLSARRGGAKARPAGRRRNRPPLPGRRSGDPEAVRDVQMEVGVMQALRGCPYVVALHEAALSGPPGAEEEAFLVMDLCSGTLAGEQLARGGRLDDATLLQAFLHTCRAVHAMHTLDPPLAHRCGGGVPSF